MSLTRNETKVASYVLRQLQLGKPENTDIMSLAGKFSGVSNFELQYGAEVGSDAWSAASQAQSGLYRNFNQLPTLRNYSGNVRVRVYVEGIGPNGLVIGSMDVIMRSSDAIAGVQQYAQSYLEYLMARYPRDDRPRHIDEMRGGDGIYIDMIQTTTDTFSKATVTR